MSLSCRLKPLYPSLNLRLLVLPAARSSHHSIISCLLGSRKGKEDHRIKPEIQEEMASNNLILYLALILALALFPVAGLIFFWATGQGRIIY